MTQDDNPTLAGLVEETPVPESLPAPPPPAPVNPKPIRRRDAVAPDPYAVGVRVLKMAPAWLLVITLCSSALILLLGWFDDGAANTVAQPAGRNDARQAPPSPAADAAAAKAALATAPESAAPANAPASAPSAADNRPALAAAQAPPPPAPAPPAPQPSAEKTQAESPAHSVDAAAKYTVQVGSFNDPSEANERVSSLRSAGFEARSVAVEIQGRGTWYRVQVGRFADRDAASKSLAEVRAKGAAAGAIVVPVQN